MRRPGVPTVFRLESHHRYGLTQAAVLAELAGNRWQRVTPTVIATHNGPVTTRQARLAAVLTASTHDSPAALGSWSALEAHGLLGWSRPQIHLVVPRGRTPPSFGSLPVVVHESRRFEAGDRRHVRDVARTSVERSAVDAASWDRSTRTACAVLAATVQQRLTSAQRLRSELLHVGQIRHRRILLAALTDMIGGAEALSEIDFLAFCRRHQLGRPDLQQVRRDVGGRRRYLDATFRSRTGRPVHVEIDGAIHLTVGSAWNDMRRANELLLVGTVALHFPSTVIHDDDPDALRQLRRALDS